MQRFLITSFIALALAVSAAGVAPAAHAQQLDLGTGVKTNSTGGGLFGGAGAPLTGSTLGTVPTSANNFGAAPLNTGSGLGDVAPTDARKNVSNEIAVDPVLPDSAIFATVTTFFMGIFAWLLGIAMVTLDNAVYYTVVKMGVYIHDLAAIGVAWRIFRDIGNIALIFGFLAIGITTILDVDWYGGGKKMLPMLIVAAVFLNFSLFISEAVIDSGNLFATQFYTQINGGVSAGQKLSLPNSGLSSVVTNAQPAMSSLERETISNKIMSQLKLQKLYSAALNPNKLAYKPNNMSLINIMGILLFIIAAFVMFSLAFVLIARFIYLIFIIITSPIGFAGLAVPQLKGLADQWWKGLFDQTITAPVLLLLLYIALAVITDAHFMSFGVIPDYAGYLQDANGNYNLSGLASMLLSFIVAMGLLLAVTISSKKLGAFGGEWATKTAGKLSFGATAWATRNTVGRGLQRASNASRGMLGGGKFERLVAGTFDRGAKRSFDVRGATIAGGLNKGLSIDAGEAQKGGYRDARDKSVKAHQEYAKSVGEAIDERKAKEVIGAMATRAAAEEVFKKGGGENFEKKIKTQKEEIEKLKKQQEENAKSTIVGPEREARDRKTNEDLEAANATLGTLTADFKNIKTPLEEAQGAEKELGAKISREKKDAQKAYAKSIEESFVGGLMFGTGGSISANKIFKDVLKKQTKEEEILDAFKASIAKAEKKDETKPEEKSKEKES
ncbi:MAG: hypothetical protein NT108_01315 [Candidatus Kaiserbacteria bacterium]|nr:hypothetical protein [Candidatus Kaiserbacteria bacterium]